MTKTKNIPTGFIIKYTTVLVLIVILFTIPSSLIFDPNHSLCIHKRIFGFQCPLCGMTRAVYELLHLNVLGSLKFNPAVIFLPVYVIIDFIDVFSGKVSLQRAKRFILIGFLAALLILYLVSFSRFIG